MRTGHIVPQNGTYPLAFGLALPLEIFRETGGKAPIFLVLTRVFLEESLGIREGTNPTAPSRPRLDLVVFARGLVEVLTTLLRTGECESVSRTTSAVSLPGVAAAARTQKTGNGGTKFQGQPTDHLCGECSTWWAWPSPRPWRWACVLPGASWAFPSQSSSSTRWRRQTSFSSGSHSSCSGVQLLSGALSCRPERQDWVFGRNAPSWV